MARIKVNGEVRTLSLLYMGHDELDEILFNEGTDFDDDGIFVMTEKEFDRISKWVEVERGIVEYIEKNPHDKILVEDIPQMCATLEEIQAMELEVLGYRLQQDAVANDGTVSDWR